ncbi:hypothetical protein [Streptosporangium sp. NPDC048865]|uniref:hypothetical protein n=1 Tax=Streptosporangium sp. NPDC048865 TaxID=3155766 RepID=UPI00342E8595
MWHDSYVLVVLAFAAVAVIAGVTVVAMGRGGELSEFAPDVPPLNLPQAGQLGAVDFMALQLPVSLVGYNTQSVDETLNRVAAALSERDTRIAVLEQRVSELLAGRLQARHELNPGSQPPQRGLEAPYELSGGDGFGTSEELSNGSPAVPHGEREAASPGLAGEGGPGAPGEPSVWSRAGAAAEEPGEPAERLPEATEPSGDTKPTGSITPSGSTAPSESSESTESEGGPDNTGNTEAAEKAGEAAPSGVSRFARPIESSGTSGTSGSPGAPDASSGKPDSGASASKESSPGSVGLRTGQRRETEDPR